MKRGFTLVEILVIITLISILITLVFYLVNPIEVAKRNRDLQRIKDLQVLESAINTYLTFSNNPDLDGPLYDLTGLDEENPSIYISIPIDQSTFTFSTITDAYGNIWQIKQNSSATNVYNNNGEGWLPINFNQANITLPQLPVDPLNIINNSANKNYFYLYVFRRGTKEFEINANLESRTFKENKSSFSALTDGGSDQEILEVGNNKCLIAFGSAASVIYGTTTVTNCPSLKLNFGINYGNLMGQDICFNKLLNFYPTRNFVFRNKSGDYLIIGNAYFNNTSSIYVNFFDSLGNLKFTKLIYFNTNTPINLEYVHQMENDHYILGYNLGDKSVLLKFDKDFNPNWSALYCHTSDCTAVQELIYVSNNVSGNINLVRNTGYFSGFQLVEISSSSGAILSGASYYYPIPFGRLYAGNKTRDGGFILLGSVGVTTIPPAFLAKFDSQNKFEWIKKYDNLSFSSHYNSRSPRNIYVFQTNDGGYFFNAMYDIASNATSYIFVKTDYFGNLEWLKKYQGDYSKIDVRKIIQDKKDNFWLLVNSSSENYLIKFDKNFNKLNEYKIKPKSSNDTLVFNNFYQLDDKTYILLGNFIDAPSFVANFFKKLNQVLASVGTIQEAKPEEVPKNDNNKYYLNLIKFISDSNLSYLNNNMFDFSTSNIFNFISINSSITNLSSFSTSTYNLTSSELNLSSQIIKPIEKAVVNQCDNYYSKNIAQNKKIEKIIKINNGYLAVGEDLSNPTSSFWLAKIDISGNIINSTSYRLNDSYLGHKLNSVIEGNNNFFVVGNYFTDSGQPNFSNGYIAKFDNNLNLISSTTPSGNIYFNDINFDGANYIAVGYSLNYTNPVGLFYIVDNNLNFQFLGTSTLNSEFNSVLIDDDKNYIIGGQINNQSYLVKVNSSTKNYMWTKEYILKPGSKESIKKNILVNNNLISLVNMFDPNDNKYKVILRKINAENGAIIQEKLISNDYFFGYDIILDYDNNFLIAGYLPLSQTENNFSDWSLALMKVDKNFNLVWVKYYGGQSQAEISYGSSIVEAYYAGYLIGGYNGANKNSLLLKVSYQGDCLGCFEISYFNIYKNFKNILANFLSSILR
ncbi:MAG: hypothetical protein KatS3mg095_0741 [Candidatus Parcubacteria bacterium]|nr:MAG: hypothetical protein KatS3mg095_0741 [Candidatus Parcubacteria bacterium]